MRVGDGVRGISAWPRPRATEVCGAGKDQMAVPNGRGARGFHEWSDRLGPGAALRL